MKATLSILAGAIAAGIALTVALLWYDPNLAKQRMQPAPAGPEKPSIKAIMLRGFRRENSLLSTIKRELEQDEVPWKDVADQAAELHGMADQMHAFHPDNGGPDSWREHTRQLGEWSTQLETAAHKQDRDTARQFEKKLAASCDACHDVHR